MKTLEYVEEIDKTLSRWEDYFHGQEGIDVTEARNNLDKIRKQLILYDVVKSLKNKHAQALFEYKQQLKETDNNDTMYIDNREEWIRQTSILEGKITILENLLA
jgi:hypothetical protein